MDAIVQNARQKLEKLLLLSATFTCINMNKDILSILFSNNTIFTLLFTSQSAGRIYTVAHLA